MNLTFFISEEGRRMAPRPFAGSGCGRAGVVPGRRYDDMLEASIDARKLATFYSAPFIVYGIEPGEADNTAIAYANTADLPPLEAPKPEPRGGGSKKYPFTPSPQEAEWLTVPEYDRRLREYLTRYPPPYRGRTPSPGPVRGSRPETTSTATRTDAPAPDAPPSETSTTERPQGEAEGEVPTESRNSFVWMDEAGTVTTTTGSTYSTIVAAEDSVWLTFDNLHPRWFIPAYRVYHTPNDVDAEV